MYKLNGKALDMINIQGAAFRKAIETVAKDQILKLWHVKRKLGSIVLSCSLSYANETEKASKLAALKDVLKDGALQIDGKFYHVSVVGGANEKLDLSNFKLMFNWIGDENVGNYVCPPSEVLVSVIGLTVSVSFVKGLDTASTKLVCGETVLSTTGNSFTFSVPKADSYYKLQLKGVDAQGNEGDAVEAEFKSATALIVPEKPANVQSSVFGKNITLTFDKGLNAIAAEVTCDGKTVVTYDNSITIITSQFNTSYEVKLRSKSETETYSDYVTLNVTTQAVAIPGQPSDFSIAVDQKKVTISFAKGTDASVTEFRINGTTYVTGDNFMVLDMPAYLTSYSFEARSKSIFDAFSSYTQPINFATNRQVIVPAVPMNVVSVTDPTDKKKITISFVKGENAVSTELLIDGNVYETTGSSIVANVTNYDTTYSYKMRSKSSTNDLSDWTRDFTCKSGPMPIIPDAPTGISVTVDKLHVVVSFTKGNNADTTELKCGALNLSTAGTSFAFDVAAFSTAYLAQLRSKSLTSDYSSYVDANFATAAEPAGFKVTNVLPKYNPYQYNYRSEDVGMNYEVDLDLAYMGTNNIERYTNNYAVLNGNLTTV